MYRGEIHRALLTPDDPFANLNLRPMFQTLSLSNMYGQPCASVSLPLSRTLVYGPRVLYAYSVQGQLFDMTLFSSWFGGYSSKYSFPPSISVKPLSDPLCPFPPNTAKIESHIALCCCCVRARRETGVRRHGGNYTTMETEGPFIKVPIECVSQVFRKTRKTVSETHLRSLPRCRLLLLSNAAYCCT